ncbi:MAG: 3-phosphoshikimate 1-carboxyvinyltransferase [Kiritimatiellae bacterium]|nr:3-phosphoshikimate 1-carboxyvinyltransferase [Kiritimatiellia bacterium]
MRIEPGRRRGSVTPPASKSHQHRLLVAAFLAGCRGNLLEDAPGDPDDIRATKRCLSALDGATDTPVLDCGESGSTFRFLAPVAAALGKRPEYVLRGRLGKRPGMRYDELRPGLHELPGDVSSQFATGLLLALPLLDGDSEIRFTSLLESRGYVDMTLAVLAASGIAVEETPTGFLVRGGQRYRAPASLVPERDWSGASFWLAMNALGSEIDVRGLDGGSRQPDKAMGRILTSWGPEIDVSQCPDIFPPLAAVAGARGGDTRFTGTRRLRMKESDRVAAMADMLCRLGVGVEAGDDAVVVHGRGAPYRGAAVRTFGDHRIAMSAAVAATCADSAVEVDDAGCVAKSYPGFFEVFASLDRF